MFGGAFALLFPGQSLEPGTDPRSFKQRCPSLTNEHELANDYRDAAPRGASPRAHLETPNGQGFATGQILSQHEAVQSRWLGTGQPGISLSGSKGVGSTPAAEITERTLL